MTTAGDGADDDMAQWWASAFAGKSHRGRADLHPSMGEESTLAEHERHTGCWGLGAEPSCPACFPHNYAAYHARHRDEPITSLGRY